MTLKALVSADTSCHKQISHPHIVSYVSSFWTPEYNCLVLEHLSGGELFELLQQPGNHKRMDEPLLRRIFTELCRGIHWLHVAGIVHRDIKLESEPALSWRAADIGTDQLAGLPVRHHVHRQPFHHLHPA